MQQEGRAQQRLQRHPQQRALRNVLEPGSLPHPMM
jgi:hypothetical protein